MSFLKKSLEKRIRELRDSIEAQKTELAAYEQVLALESGKPMVLAPAPAAIAEAVKQHSSGASGNVGFSGRLMAGKSAAKKKPALAKKA